MDYGMFAAALVRYQIAGNFLGLPAVTVPVLINFLNFLINLPKFHSILRNFCYIFIYFDGRLVMIEVGCQ